MLPFLRAGRPGARRPSPTSTRADVARIVEALGDRLKVFGDILLQAAFFFGDEVTFDDKAFAKRVLAPGAAERLADYRGWLADADRLRRAGAGEGHPGPAGRRKGLGLGDIVHAVRVAVTGIAVGPGLFDCLAVLGKETCLRRIDRALAKARAG